MFKLLDTLFFEALAKIKELYNHKTTIWKDSTA